nr:hypothetical protein CFP56_37904 [Quercus suber]
MHSLQAIANLVQSVSLDTGLDAIRTSDASDTVSSYSSSMSAKTDPSFLGCLQRDLELRVKCSPSKKRIGTELGRIGRNIRQQLLCGSFTNEGIVGDLIDHGTRTWKADLVRRLYPFHQASTILQIHISKTNSMLDKLCWKFSNNGEYLVHKAFDILSRKEACQARFFQAHSGWWRSLWKIKDVFITLWTIWNYQNKVVNRGIIPNPMDVILNAQNFSCKYKDSLSSNQISRRKEGGCSNTRQQPATGEIKCFLESQVPLLELPLEHIWRLRLKLDWQPKSKVFKIFCLSVIAKGLCRPSRRNVPRIGWTTLGLQTPAS